MDYTVNVRGRLIDLSSPKVMGILNATPDSFYAVSRQQTEQQIAARANEIIAQGGAIIDVGACSTRPGAILPSKVEEMERLRRALTVVRRQQPRAVVSVDTFRPDVARMAVEEYGADIVNDVGGAALAQTDAGNRRAMFRMVSRLRVPYILMSAEATLGSMLMQFARDVQQLRDMGQKDIILDPGFGFGKQRSAGAGSLIYDTNFEVLQRLERLQEMRLPVLVGLSRKSMIYKTLDTSPEESLNGTTMLHTVALMKGAAILRAHDVRQAVECVALWQRLNTVTPAAGCGAAENGRYGGR